MSTPPNIYIAVVDDDEGFCRSLGRLLRAADYQPVTYLSAEAFLADVKHPRFDCLLLDVTLGGMSGLELGRRLAAVGSTTPVIYITAHDDPATRTAAEAAGCFAFVSKVETGGELLKAIVSAVRSQLN
jgi:FixJ family two-component response regulator